MIKPYIAGAVGVLALGGLALATTRNSQSPAQTSYAAPAEGQIPMMVNCGVGRRPVVRPGMAGAPQQIECIDEVVNPLQPALGSYGLEPNGLQSGPLGNVPAIEPVAAPVRTVVQERIVYRDRPTRSTARRSNRNTRTPARESRSQSRTEARDTDYDEPVYRETEPRRRTRSTAKSAIIIGGSTAGGAAVGGIIGGKKGAIIGGVLAGVGGTIYDRKTRNPRN